MLQVQYENEHVGMDWRVGVDRKIESLSEFRFPREVVKSVTFCLRSLYTALELNTRSLVLLSEPFGLTAIEVIDHCTPLIISKNCGANEIIGHKLEVDFFDSDKMAEYVLALQRYPQLRRTLRSKAMDNRARLTWEAQASRMMELYDQF